MSKFKDSIISKIIIIDVLSCILAYFLFNYLDIITADYQWILYMREHGYLHIYDTWDLTFPIDYPPLYVGWLYLIKDIVGDMSSNYTQLVMKSLPLAVQIIAQAYIYRKISPEAALKWSLNLAILVNIVWYGQRDGIIGLLILLFFVALKKNKWFEPGIIITIFCLLKPQGFYLCFILLLYYVIKNTPILKILVTFISSISIGYLAFIPFALTTGDWLIAFKVYLFAFKRHPNFGAMSGTLLGPFEFFEVPQLLLKYSVILIILCMLLSVFIYHKTKDFMYTSIVYMWLLFMITLSQQGRYSIYTMFIIYIMLYIYQNNEYAEIYKLTTITAALAQIGMLLYNHYSISFAGFDPNATVTYLTYKELYSLYGIRIITIIITLLINIIISIKLIRLKTTQNVTDSAENVQ